MPSNLPSPCWGAIVIRLAALTLPSGPCRGVWAQLDSPIASQQIQQLSQTSLQSCSFFWDAEKLERHVITAIMIMIAAACLIPLQAANGAVVAGTSYFSPDRGPCHYISSLWETHFVSSASLGLRCAISSPGWVHFWSQWEFSNKSYQRI